MQKHGNSARPEFPPLPGKSTFPCYFTQPLAPHLEYSRTVYFTSPLLVSQKQLRVVLSLPLQPVIFLLVWKDKAGFTYTLCPNCSVTLKRKWYLLFLCCCWLMAPAKSVRFNICPVPLSGTCRSILHLCGKALLEKQIRAPWKGLWNQTLGTHKESAVVINMQLKLLLVEEQNRCVCWLEAQNPAQSFIRNHMGGLIGTFPFQRWEADNWVRTWDFNQAGNLGGSLSFLQATSFVTI